MSSQMAASTGDVCKRYANFYWQRAMSAAIGTSERANALWWLIGSGILWIALFAAGFRTEAPTSVTGVVGFAVLQGLVSIVLAWIAIFLLRFALAPANLYETLPTENQTLTAAAPH